MSHDHIEAPVRRRLSTPSYRTITPAGLIATFMVAVRFVVGLRPMTNLTDVFPRGAWKIFNAIVLTALGSGGYALAVDVDVSAVNFPSVMELVVTTGLIAILGTIYLFVVKNFPILTAPNPGPARI